MQISDIFSPEKRIFIILLLVVGIYLYSTKNLGSTNLFILVISAILILAVGKEPIRDDVISLPEAKVVGNKYIRQKVADGVLESGKFSEAFDGKLLWRDGKPWKYLVAFKTNYPAHPIYLIEMLPFVVDKQKIIGTYTKAKWSSDDAPDIEYIIPPDAVTWMQRKREAEKQIEHALNKT